MIRLVIRFLSLLLPLFILVSCRTQPQSQLPASTPLDVASVTWPPLRRIPGV